MIHSKRHEVLRSRYASEQDARDALQVISKRFQTLITSQGIDESTIEVSSCLTVNRGAQVVVAQTTSYHV